MEDTGASDFDYARYDRIRPIRWTGEALELLDQRRLPFAVEYVVCSTSDEVAAAIHSLDSRVSMPRMTFGCTPSAAI